MNVFYPAVLTYFCRNSSAKENDEVVLENGCSKKFLKFLKKTKGT